MLSNRNLIAAAAVVALLVGGFFFFNNRQATEEVAPSVTLEILVPAPELADPEEN